MKRFFLVSALSVCFLFPPAVPKAKAQTLDSFSNFGGAVLNDVPLWILGWGFGKLMDKFISPSGATNVDEMRKSLDKLASSDAKNRAQYLELSERLGKCATVIEVREALEYTVARFDSKLGGLAHRVYALERSRDEWNAKLKAQQITLDEHAARIAALNKTSDHLLNEAGVTRERLGHLDTQMRGVISRIGVAEMRIDKVEREFDEFRRWNPAEVAVKAAVAGFELHFRGRSAEAVPILRQALAFAPEDCAIAYLLCTALHASGNEAEARLAAAVGIAAEHKRGPSMLWYNVRDRLQGPSRQFLTSLRDDPINGARSSGMYRILEVVADPRSNGTARVVEVSIPALSR